MIKKKYGNEEIITFKYHNFNTSKHNNHSYYKFKKSCWIKNLKINQLSHISIKEPSLS